MADEPLRSRAAREAAERALVRIAHHYGACPEFVVRGGLVPGVTDRAIAPTVASVFD